MKHYLQAIVVLLLLAIAGTAAFVYSGIYPVDATTPHPAPLYHLLHYTMQRAVAHHARGITVPGNLNDEDRIRSGFALYRAHCLQCHGAPGVGPDALAHGMMPEPPNLLPPAREWSASEIYWAIRHGIKMTAMPGWHNRLNDAQIWDVVAFVEKMPLLSAQEYKQYERLVSPPSPSSSPAPLRTAGDENDRLGNPDAGRRAIQQNLCATCHRIPGIAGADKNVGPPLAGIATRQYIGGVLLNTPQNMLRWLRNPPAVDPLTAMPDLHLREQDARDIAAYLYTLDKAE